ncbi:MAG: ABC transporter permease [Sporichthyaceae bacterium]|nr:ABC transporter permease [Sporichthyaceae bacterium]
MSAIPTVAEQVELPAIGRHRGLGRRLTTSVSGRIGVVLVALMISACAAAIVGALPYDPIAQDTTARLRAPSGSHLLGTDQFGRDTLSRVLAGVAASLRVAVIAVAIAATVGSLAGLAGGFLGGWADAVLGRVADVLFAFPALLLALALVTALGRGWLNTALAIALVYTPIFARVARGPVLAVRDADFVRAGRVLGYSSLRLMFRHVLPNVSAPIIVQTALALSWAVLTESTLSFLGLGVEPPAASLGAMVQEGRNLASLGWWTLAAPAVTVTAVVVGMNLLGDGLRDALDPRTETK